MCFTSTVVEVIFIFVYINHRGDVFDLRVVLLGSALLSVDGGRTQGAALLRLSAPPGSFFSSVNNVM